VGHACSELSDVAVGMRKTAGENSFVKAHILAVTRHIFSLATTRNMNFATIVTLGVAITVMKPTTGARSWLSETAFSINRRIEYLPTSTRIVNGKRAKEYLSFGVCAGSKLCGGTLIHDDMFLSAARKCDNFWVYCSD
jgi:hypothetical protein